MVRQRFLGQLSLVYRQVCETEFRQEWKFSRFVRRCLTIIFGQVLIMLTASPLKTPNCQRRTREHLLPQEVEAMLKAARNVGRHSHRDAALILIAYRHGLRVSELVALRWNQVDFNGGTIYINRLKHGVSSIYPLRGPELRSLRQLQRDYPDFPYLFVSEQGAAMAADTARGIIERTGQLAGIPFPGHPICCVMPVVSTSPPKGMTPERFKRIWVTRTFSTPCAIPSWHRDVLRISGWIER